MRILTLTIFLLLLSLTIKQASANVRILSQSDILNYKTIFALQKDSKWNEADKYISLINDKILLDHVYYQRYLHSTKYRSKYLELRDWLAKYSNHPLAGSVYRLALRRKPKNYRNPPLPSSPKIPQNLEISINENNNNKHTLKEIRVLREVRSNVYEGFITGSWNYLKKYKRSMNNAAYAEGLGYITRGYYRYNKYKLAIKVADIALNTARKGQSASGAAWWAGLSAWRLKKYKKAAQLFIAVYHNEKSNQWLRAAGAFWAGRAYDKINKKYDAQKARKFAATIPRSFYGILAANTLQKKPNINWKLALKSKYSNYHLLKIKAVRKAIALVECGQGDLADIELKPIISRLTPEASIAMLNIIKDYNLAHSKHNIARKLAIKNKPILFADYYPKPNWLIQSSQANYNIDIALTLAVTLQESQFQRHAKSHAGARGVMQLMPATASFINGKRIPRSQQYKLFYPQFNVPLGQKYLAYLLSKEIINKNLLSTIIAYNAGPGNFKKWQKKINVKNDPLLFIESLPSRESRIYVERVMANLWIYRWQLNQKTPSLESLTNGKWPLYKPQDQQHIAPNKNNPNQT